MAVWNKAFHIVPSTAPVRLQRTLKHVILELTGVWEPKEATSCACFTLVEENRNAKCNIVEQNYSTMFESKMEQARKLPDNSMTL